MTNLENERLVNYLVVADKPGRRFTAENDTRWGGLIEPGQSENPGKTGTGLKVAIFASWDFGYLVFETLKDFETRFPGELNIVGLVTDDPLNPDAKISLKKRIWSHLERPYHVIDETSIIESALSHGVPVYLGEIKVESFHRILEKWNPDAIIVCVFGQLIDSFIINFPRYGIYNFHPSDLLSGQGAGPAPYDDLAARNAGTTVWSVHHVSEEIDGGKVIGQSPLVNVHDSNGNLPGDPLVVFRKLAEILSPLSYFLVKELTRNFELNHPARLDHVNFDDLIPGYIKTRILQPVGHGTMTSDLSFPEDYLYKPG